MIQNLLIATNIICFFLHVLLEVFLWKMEFPFIGFVLIENALISLLYVFFAWSFFRKKVRLSLMALHTAFWLIFTSLVIILRPSETSLEIFSSWIEFPQWIALLLTGASMASLSIINIYHKREGKGKEK